MDRFTALVTNHCLGLQHECLRSNSTVIYFHNNPAPDRAAICMRKEVQIILLCAWLCDCNGGEYCEHFISPDCRTYSSWHPQWGSLVTFTRILLYWGRGVMHQVPGYHDTVSKTTLMVAMVTLKFSPQAPCTVAQRVVNKTGHVNREEEDLSQPNCNAIRPVWIFNAEDVLHSITCLNSAGQAELHCPGQFLSVLTNDA